MHFTNRIRITPKPTDLIRLLYKPLNSDSIYGTYEACVFGGIEDVAFISFTKIKGASENVGRQQQRLIQAHDVAAACCYENSCTEETFSPTLASRLQQFFGPRRTLEARVPRRLDNCSVGMKNWKQREASPRERMIIRDCEREDAHASFRVAVNLALKAQKTTSV